MNRYILIRRLRGPAFLLLVGVLALLSQADILGWGESWPLFLILAGVLALAERAALATGGYPPPPQGAWPGVPMPGASGASGSWPGTNYPQQAASPQTPAAQTPAEPGFAMVPASSQALTKDTEGGRS